MATRFVKGLRALPGRILGGIIGCIIILGTVGLVDWYLTSRQVINPGEIAIIREVWHREGPLWGPTSPPYRVRVVENRTENKKKFLIQPYPFGYVEEIVEKEEIKEFSFRVPSWRKDSITQDPNDASIVRVCSAEGKLKTEDAGLYARNLDHKQVPHARKADSLYAVRQSLTRKGQEPVLDSREELLSELIYLDFTAYLSQTLSEWEESLAQKYQVLTNYFRENKITSAAEKREHLADFFKQYPWYKVEPKVFQEELSKDPTTRDLFQEYVEATQEEDTSKTRQALDKIHIFFEEYIRENPDVYHKEKWDFIENLIIEKSVDSPDFDPRYGLSFAEEQIQLIEENYVKILPQDIEKTYGVKIFEFGLQMMDELTVKYPTLLR